MGQLAHELQLMCRTIEQKQVFHAYALIRLDAIGSVFMIVE